MTEISQAEILAGGGFPYVIDTPGSYILTSNLDIRGLPGALDLTVIDITVDQVTVDLNGFAILGTADCDVGVPGCVGGSGVGVNASPQPDGVTVRNGTIQGMGSFGVRLADYGVVENLIARKNVAGGISVSSFSRAIDNVSSENSGDGISGGSSILVAGNVSVNNFGHGIRATSSAVVRENTVSDNGGDGIHTGNDGVIVGNTSMRNDGDGILSINSAMVRDNTSRGNGGDGIQVNSGVVIANTMSFNTGLDLNMDVSPSTGYVRNRVSSSTAISGGRQLGPNLCGASLCP